MKMKSLLLGLLLCGIVCSVSYADTDTVNTAKNEDGWEPDPMYGGYKYFRLTGTTEQTVCAGRCLLGEIYMSPGIISGKVDVWDTVTSGWLSTTPAGTLLASRRFVISTSTSQRPKLARPMRARQGISAKLSSVGSDTECTIAYIELGPL